MPEWSEAMCVVCARTESSTVAPNLLLAGACCDGWVCVGNQVANNSSKAIHLLERAENLEMLLQGTKDVMRSVVLWKEVRALLPQSRSTRVFCPVLLLILLLLLQLLFALAVALAVVIQEETLDSGREDVRVCRSLCIELFLQF